MRLILGCAILALVSGCGAGVTALAQARAECLQSGLAESDVDQMVTIVTAAQQDGATATQVLVNAQQTCLSDRCVECASTVVSAVYGLP